MIKRLLITILLVLIPTTVFSAPAITDFIGDADNGNILTIVGTSFSDGKGSTAAPLIWDNFESGSDGALLSTGGWTYADLAKSIAGAYYSDEYAYSGSLSARNHVYSYPFNNFDTNYKSFTQCEEIYMSTSYLMHVISGNIWNWKGSRVCCQLPNDRSYYYGTTKFIPQNKMDTANYYGGIVHFYTGAGELYNHDRHPTVSQDTWFRSEGYGTLSTEGVADGMYWATSKNLEPTNSFEHGCYIQNVMTRPTGYGAEKFETYLLGLMCGEASDGANFKLYIDDVYVDNTQARVELGDAASFYSCSHRELQIPTDTTPDGDGWDDTSIQVTVNTTGFSTDDVAYMYVIDGNGNISNGRAITIGDTYVGSEPEDEPDQPYVNDCTVTGVSAYIIDDGNNTYISGNGFGSAAIDFTSPAYTEVDSASDITVGANTVSFSTMRRDANSYVYYDYGAGSITDLTVNFDINITACDIGALARCLAIGDKEQASGDDAINVFFYRNATGSKIGLEYWNGEVYYIDEWLYAELNTRYYLTFKRIGTTMWLYIYSDSERQTLIDTLTTTCEASAWQYLYCLKSRYDSGTPAPTITGTISNYVCNEIGTAYGNVYLCDDALQGGSLTVEQVVSVWGNDSIAFTVDQGDFSDGDTAYVIVKNTSGSFSNGFPVEFYLAGSPLGRKPVASGSVGINGGLRLRYTEN